MPVLHPDTVLDLLRVRIRTLEKQIGEEQVMLDAARKAGLPRLLLIEAEFHLALRDTELSWVRDLAGDLEAGTLEGQDAWRTLAETGQLPGWSPDMAALDALREQAEGGITPD
jgi:hypothetical protein